MGTPLAVGITAGVVCICACVAICLCLKYRRDNPGSGNNNSNTEVILASGGKENNIGDIGNTAIKMRDKNVDWADETEMNNDLDTKEFIPETRLPANASLADKEQFKRIVEPKIAEWRETLEKTMKGGNDDTQDIWNLKEQVGQYQCQIKFQFTTNINEYQERGVDLHLKTKFGYNFKQVEQR